MEQGQGLQGLLSALQALMGGNAMPKQSSGEGLSSLLQNAYGSPVQQQQTAQQQPQHSSQLGVDDLLNHAGGVDFGKIIESILQGRSQDGTPSNTGFAGGSAPQGNDSLQGLRAMLGYNS